MVNVNVKAADIGFQSADTGKTAGTGVKGAQSQEFRKLLQGRQNDSQDNGQDGSGTQKVSKDGEQDNTEAAAKPEESKGKDSGREDPQEETVSTDDSQTRGLLAAYQMGQGLRPELLTAEPEVVIEMPEIAVETPEAVPETAAELTAAMPEQTEVRAEAVSTAAVEEVFPVTEEAVKPQETVQAKEEAVPVKEPQSIRAKEPEVREKEPEVQSRQPRTEEQTAEAPVRRETVKQQASGEESRIQSVGEQTDQSAAAPVTQAPVKMPEEAVKPQEAVKVYVPQTEELPDKLTDQIMSKMEEGVQSFEIEIEPENLGKISVKILYEDGQATVSVLCTEKKALDVLGNHAREIGGIIDRNLGGETKIFVEKQEPDYLNQERDGDRHGKQEEQEQQKERQQKQEPEDSEQFLQKLRLGLTG